MTDWPSVSYFADGRHVPDLLNEAEAIVFLRLDEINVKSPQNTLRRYREGGSLQAVQVGKQILYPLPKLREFVLKRMEANPR